MRTIARTLLILAAALAVVGATIAFRQSPYAGMLSSGEPERGGFERPAGEIAQEAPAGFEPGAGRGHHDEWSLGGLVEAARNLAIMGVIIAIAVLVGYGRDLRRMR
jgi:hypothetical protein